MFFDKFYFVLRYMKGYKKLVNENNLSILAVLIENLVKTKISNTNFYLKFDNNHIDLITAQYLKIKLLDLNFNKKILISIHTGNSITHPLPYEWRLTLEDFGINANTYINRIIWIFYCIKMFLIGVATIFFNIFYILQISFFKKKYKNNYIYFDSLEYNSIPSDINYNNIITWYYKWIDRQSNVSIYYHNVKTASQINFNNISINFIKNPFVPLENNLTIIKYIFWNIFFLKKLFTDIFKGLPINLVFSREISKASIFLFANNDVMAKDYLFHNSNHIYRPIWTYFAEKKGSRILFYFYSTNLKTLNYHTSNYIQENTWFLCTWSNYLAWDIYTSNFLKKNITFNKKNIYIVGPIMFSSKLINKAFPFKDYILIFDVQPFRESLYSSLGVIHRYYRSEISINFFNDILKSCNPHNYPIIIKRKRKIGNIICRKYDNYIKNIKKNIYIADEDTDIHNLIPNAKAVISMPFTSTSIWAKFYNINTIFYDPTGDLIFTDDDTHGIDVKNNHFELENWINNL